jgi:membrane protease YdiL (CAAX protease family)
MERPNDIAIAPSALAFDPVHAALDAPGPLTLRIGASNIGHAVGALFAFGLFGAAIGQALTLVPGATAVMVDTYSHALALLFGHGAALAVLFQRLASRAPTALRDRSAFGCAWFGAPDDAVAHAFLLGGAIATITVIASPSPEANTATSLAFDGEMVAAMTLAFAAIAVAPVAEELLFRGALFATLRTRCSSLTAAIVVSIAFIAAHPDKFAAGPAAVLGTLVVGIGAMVLRLRHASLAPAIALHCGNNFVACVVIALV